MNELEIKIGLPPIYYSQDAKICTEAFYDKTKGLLGSPEQMQSLIAKSFNPDLAIVALINDRLIGVAGMAFKKRHFITPSRSIFIEQFGIFSGLIKHLIYRTFSIRPYEPEQLLLEAIAIEPNMRGLGIGTLLITELENYAQQNLLNSIRLEVINTNSKAKKLYERIGFKTTKVEHNFFLEKIVGISGISTMVKETQIS